MKKTKRIAPKVFRINEVFLSKLFSGIWESSNNFYKLNQSLPVKINTSKTEEDELSSITILSLINRISPQF
jgi:hypothetical protein